VSKEDHYGPSRRQALRCLAWAGTGVLWTVAGGVPRSLGIVGEAEAATSSFSFVQISDSHIGFAKAANPNVVATLKQAVGQVNGMSERPAFVLHTGDVTHLSKPTEFDAARQVLGELKVDRVHYVPGEHDVLNNGMVDFNAHLGRRDAPNGWYSFDQGGVHFVALVNVLDFQPGSLPTLGADQLDWLRKDLSGLSASTPLVVFAHIPLWSVYPRWGWATGDAEAAMALLRRFGSVTVLNGHIHQVAQKVEGQITFHTAMSTAFPQPQPGAAESPGPMLVPGGELGDVLGITNVGLVAGSTMLVDTPLGGIN
jgi:3',5'-cyclic AMP phosphodiesterase CpdA